MNRRALRAKTDPEAEHLTLAQLNQLIAQAEYGVQSKSKSSLRKLAFKRLLWLEGQRERLHGIPAPDRRPLPRGSN